MRRVVVEHEMNVLLAGSLHIDATQKLQELLVPMAPMTRADDLSRLNVERRKERGHSMAQVVVRLPLGHARAHGKDRLRTVQRLDLRFLIDAQDQRIFRRRHVQSHDVASLLDK